jgi:hypothetical protein
MNMIRHNGISHINLMSRPGKGIFTAVETSNLASVI